TASSTSTGAPSTRDGGRAPARSRSGPARDRRTLLRSGTPDRSDLRECPSWRGAPRVKALVTGAAGVVGDHLVRPLEACGRRVSLGELPLTEDSPLRPVSPYAASKIAADYLGLQAWLGYGLEVLRVRAFNHLGPGQTSRFVAPALAERIALNELEGSEVVPV